MKFSVIIPLYNKAPYIRKALESVFVQTYTDYEVIIVDDGSTDESANIAELVLRECKVYGVECKGMEHSNAENKAHRLLKQKNAGVSAARNNGVAASHGEFVCFLDADDWWEPTYLERMAKLIEDYPEAGLYGMNYIYYKPGKTRVALKCQTGYINYPKEYYEGGAMMIFTSSSSSMPKRVFEEMGGFPLGIRLGEDFLLWAKTALHYKVAFCDEPLAYYNNDVPATLRATRNLHKPEYHMLFRLELLGERLEAGGEEWQKLIDKLRVNGLLDYWMSKEYHDLAAEELNKVDWSKQPASVKRMYKTPIWMLKAKRLIMRWGSFVKQRIIKVRGYRL